MAKLVIPIGLVALCAVVVAGFLFAGRGSPERDPDSRSVTRSMIGSEKSCLDAPPLALYIEQAIKEDQSLSLRVSVLDADDDQCRVAQFAVPAYSNSGDSYRTTLHLGEALGRWDSAPGYSAFLRAEYLDEHRVEIVVSRPTSQLIDAQVIIDLGSQERGIWHTVFRNPTTISRILQRADSERLRGQRQRLNEQRTQANAAERRRIAHCNNLWISKERATSRSDELALYRQWLANDCTTNTLP